MAKKKIVEEIVEEVVEELEETIDEDQGRASFEIHNGKDIVRFKAQRDCWAMQEKFNVKDPDTGIVTQVWKSSKYFSDLANVGSKVFDMRLKNCDATTLSELADCAKAIKAQLQAEFKLTGCGCAR